MGEKPPPCDRCGHSPDDHHLDDRDDPADPEAPPYRCVVWGCRCVGYIDPRQLTLE